MKIFVLTVMTLLAGCATTANIQPDELIIDPTAGQFIPVKVFYNRKVPVARFYVSRLEAVEASLKESGAFFDLGAHVRSPVILDIELNRGTNDSVVDTASQLLSAATLFLVPTKAKNFNTLKVDVYAYGKLIRTYQYQQEYEQVIGLYNYNEVASNEGNEFLAIKAVVNKFVNEVERDKLLPKVVLGEDGQPIYEDESELEPEASNSLHPKSSISQLVLLVN